VEERQILDRGPVPQVRVLFLEARCPRFASCFLDANLGAKIIRRCVLGISTLTYPRLAPKSGANLGHRPTSWMPHLGVLAI